MSKTADLLWVGAADFVWGVDSMRTVFSAAALSTFGAINGVTTLSALESITMLVAQHLPGEDGSGTTPDAPAYTSPNRGTPEYDGRREELAKDPAHGGIADAQTRREADVGLAAEAGGTIPGPITRAPFDEAGEDQGEFFDANGQLWDVKFSPDMQPSYRPDAGKDIPDPQSDQKFIQMISGELDDDTGVLLDPDGTSASRRSYLQEIIDLHEEWREKVKRSMDYSISRRDVRDWPVDPLARRALESFFSSLEADPDTFPILSGRGLDFSGADLSGMDFASAEWSSADLSGIRMRSSCLVHAWMLQSTLTGADFTGSTLRKALLRGCSAKDSILVGTQLNKTDLSDGDFRRADFHDTNLAQAFMPGIDLRGANLAGSSWGNAPRNASLADARLAGANVEGMRGDMTDRVDIGTDESQLVDGAELRAWFCDNGAPDVAVWSSYKSFKAAQSRND